MTMTPDRQKLTVSAVEQAKSEILADIANGVVPETVSSFMELHDYVDANTYGGLCDEDSPHITIGFPPNAEDFMDVEEVLAVQDPLDAWLAAGRPSA